MGEFFYRILLTPFWDLFQVQGCTGRRRSDEAVIAKKADMWP